MPSKKSTIKLDPTLRISEAAKLLGVTPMTLRRWEEASYISPLRVGPRKDRRYKKEDILRLLNEGIK
jgi:excisionase family DNA binding protein